MDGQRNGKTILDQANILAELFYRFLPKKRRYRHTFDDLDLLFLRKLWHEVIRSEKNNVHLSTLGASYAERSRITQLRFHGLVAKVRGPKGKHVPGHWLITRRGGQFLRGEVTIPKVVETVDNTVMHDRPVGELISVQDFRVLDDFSAHYTWEIDDNDHLRAVGQSRLL